MSPVAPRFDTLDETPLPTGITLSESGHLTGTPISVGGADFTVQVTDNLGRIAKKSLHLDIILPLEITTIRLNDGLVNTAYNQAIEAIGGFGNHVWRLTNGNLPPGIEFSAESGMLHGTPTETTCGTLVFAVTDQDGRIAYKDFNIQITEPLEIVTNALPDGHQESEYSEIIRTYGGIEPFEFSFSGQLPTGLALDAETGIISGIPTVTTLRNILVTVTDSYFPTPMTTSRYLSLRICSDLTIITPAVFPSGKIDETFHTVMLQAAGGPSPYEWGLVTGFMPNGLNLDTQTGEIAGTPTEKGDFIFVIRVIDAEGATAEKEFFLHIASFLEITTAIVPDGAHEIVYNFPIEVVGGLPPYAWRVKSGELPVGLSINQDTGFINGIPTATSGEYPFWIEVNDSDIPAQTVRRNFKIFIHDDLFLITPADFLPNGRVNHGYTATVNAALGTPPYSWNQFGNLPPGLDFDEASTTSKATIAGVPTVDGDYVFTVVVNDSENPLYDAFREYTITIYTEVSIPTEYTDLEPIYRDEPYEAIIFATGGQLPYHWEVTEGQLPTGLTLNTDTGTILGTVDSLEIQSAVFTLEVTDSGIPSQTIEKEFALYVVDPLDILNDNIQNGEQNSFYWAQLDANGGIMPYTWGLDGELPEGVLFDVDTGLIEGWPTECGTYNFTISVADSTLPIANFDDHAYQMAVVCRDAAFVESDGVCGGHPDIEECYRSIQNAIDDAVGPDKILINVAEGIYRESIIIDKNTPVIIGWDDDFTSASPTTPVIIAGHDKE